MSIQTQIDRISGAVSSALAALTEKGVTVPDGATVDGLADLIAAIEAGGGGDSGNFDFSNLGGVNTAISGTFVTTELTMYHYIDTGLYNLTPKLALYYTEDNYTDTTKYKPLAVLQAHITEKTGFVLAVLTMDCNSFATPVTTYIKPYLFNATSAVTTANYYEFNNNYSSFAFEYFPASSQLSFGGFCIRTGSSYAGYFEPGVTYKYILMGVV